jgi:hypothetical protein
MKKKDLIRKMDTGEYLTEQVRRRDIKWSFYLLREAWKELKRLGQEEKAREWLIKNVFKGYSVKRKSKGE